MSFEWQPNFIPNKIFVFGCGGTGSRVVPLLAQFIKSCPWVPNPEMYIFDFDEVEEKNLLRQNFISTDVGKNKAVVLANRYSKAFNMNITPYRYKFSILDRNKNGDLLNTFTTVSSIISTQNRCNNLFILCVDTPDARKDIVSSIVNSCSLSHHNMVIDAGNENDFGQVSFSSTLGADSVDSLNQLREKTPIKCDIPYIPLDHNYFDGMVATSTPSCAELDQTMAINSLMAVNILAIVQNLYYVKPMSFYRINISLQHGAVPQYINNAYIRECSEPTKFPRSTLVYNYLNRGSLRKAISIALDDQHEFDTKMAMAEAAEFKRRTEEAKQVATTENVVAVKTEVPAEEVPAKKIAKKVVKPQIMEDRPIVIGDIPAPVV
jgi:hypothetical protein